MKIRAVQTGTKKLKKNLKKKFFYVFLILILTDIKKIKNLLIVFNIIDLFFI